MDRNEMIRQMDLLKPKLMSALAMLLISAILFTNTTYAWFVISAAPEVSGVTTSAGSNGALEIALQSTDPKTQRRAEITAPVGSSVGAGRDAKEANLYWGNLVALDEDYGFESMVMYPSALYVDQLNRVDLSHVVQAPVFGSDGRLARLDPASKARYTENGFTFNTAGGAYAGSDYGVNMLGFFYEGQKPTSSTVTVYDRKQVVTDMTTQMETLREQMKQDVQDLMLRYSDDLYRWFYLTLQIYEEKEYQIDYSDDDKVRISDMLSELEVVVGNAYDSLGYALMAYAASDMTNYPNTEEGRLELGGLFSSYSTMTTAAVRELAEKKGYADLVTAAEAIDGMVGSIRESQNNVESSIQMTVAFLIGNTSGAGLMIDGITPAANNANDMRAALAHLLFGKIGDEYVRDGTDPVTNTVDFWKTKSAGVFSPLAELIGDYPANMYSEDFSITKEIPLPWGGYSTETIVASHEITSNIRVTSGKTASEYEPSINVGVLGRVSEAVESRKGSTTGTIDVNQSSLSKMAIYGYEIDLAFRSSEAGTLKLESQALDRITGMTQEVAEDTGRYNAAIQGSGSNVTFTLSGAMTAEQAMRLIPEVYVVFVSTQTGTVYGVATGDSVKITGTKATADLVLHEPVFDENGLLSKGIVRSNQAILASMEPDQAQYVSVIVYVNAATVDSTMFAHGGTTSIEGSVNLQFVNGTATLTPMPYTDFAE